jgi:putative FmdB family regulatory protein
MPTYEYRCDKCGHEFEREQRITEDPIKSCPKCRSQKARRLISVTSFVLKGGGWYSDLYSSGSGKQKNDSESASGSTSAASGAGGASASTPESGSAATTESKSDAKPAPSESKPSPRKKSGKSAAA